MNTPKETPKNTSPTNLSPSFTARRSRRTLLKGAAGAAGVAVAGASILSVSPAYAKFAHPGNEVTGQQNQQVYRTSQQTADSIVDILTVARTAEQLAVTFYTNGIANADKLGITGDNLAYLKAALVEEQIHQQFFAANGGKSLADTFSFPQGPQTFTDLKTFIATQQQLEGVFDSAFLAAIMEFAQLGRPDLAQIAGQVATVESEHRALGRVIGGLVPADNWAFTPVLVTSVGAAPALVQKAGYLSPMSGNSYTYKQVDTSGAGVEQLKPFSMSAGTVVGNG
ncbi:MAG: hypothetical protein PVS3B3_11490 [Ktedonobacteraceae bacterium]